MLAEELSFPLSLFSLPGSLLAPGERKVYTLCEYNRSPPGKTAPSAGQPRRCFSPFFRSFYTGQVRTMKVILLQDVEGLGKAGDLKEVANGYARNYLLPRKLAAGATPALLASREQRIAAEKRRLEKQEQMNRELAERLSRVKLVFRARVGRGGRLYGSVTSQDIALGLREAEGIALDRRAIELPSPLRTTGTFEIPIKIAHNLEPRITVTVLDEAAAEEQSSGGSQEAESASDQDQDQGAEGAGPDESAEA
jgi:large subunit ribosomal protein L9